MQCRRLTVYAQGKQWPFIRKQKLTKTFWQVENRRIEKILHQEATEETPKKTEGRKESALLIDRWEIFFQVSKIQLIYSDIDFWICFPVRKKNSGQSATKTVQLSPTLSFWWVFDIQVWTFLALESFFFCQKCWPSKMTKTIIEHGTKQYYRPEWWIGWDLCEAWFNSNDSIQTKTIPNTWITSGCWWWISHARRYIISSKWSNHFFSLKCSLKRIR